MKSEKSEPSQFLTVPISQFLTNFPFHTFQFCNIIYRRKFDVNVKKGTAPLTAKKGEIKMLSYIIEGGNKLNGTISVSGSKNASLPIIAGTILSAKTTKLYHVPNIHDTQIALKRLNLLGCKVNKNHDKIEINTRIVIEILDKMRIINIFR